MPLFVVNEGAPDTYEDVAATKDGKWAVKTWAMPYWIGGFETREEAQLIADMVSEVEDHVRESMNWS